MSLILTAEQGDLRDVVRRLLDEHAPRQRLRDFVDCAEGVGGRDGLWSLLCRAELTGIGLPVEFGGTGSGRTELGLVLQELGRGLVPSPYLASVALAGGALALLGDRSAAEEVLPGIAAGETLAAFAAVPPGATGAPVRGPDGITGSVAAVVDGMLADVLLVEAVGPQGDTEYHLVDADAPGLTRTPLVAVDPTRPVARLTFESAPSRRIDPADPGRARERIAAHAAFVLAAEQLGGLLHCVETAVEYAAIRVQFGRVIGSFQAVKHRLADMFTAGELATSLVREAARAADEEPEGFTDAAHAAYAFCSRRYVEVARDTIQLHGGIGFTWEHDAHLYYKRAHVTRNMLGGPTVHEELVGERLLST
ncbi:acyl-CoA dehydrogenase family protein [Actinomadura viridis]|uniref:acyl-CoA dehydrogenase family protein n=1 Tax=Actinomadura viridis TaxID=58110 RepID=UPI0036C933F0